MTTPQTPTTILILSVVVSVIYGIVIATGVLGVALAATAMFKGYSLGDLYVEIFPRFRGPSGALRIPPLAYASFFLYVIGAAEIAVLCRKRVAKRWSKEV